MDASGCQEDLSVSVEEAGLKGAQVVLRKRTYVERFLDGDNSVEEWKKKKEKNPWW